MTSSSSLFPHLRQQQQQPSHRMMSSSQPRQQGGGGAGNNVSARPRAATTTTTNPRLAVGNTGRASILNSRVAPGISKNPYHSRAAGGGPSLSTAAVAPTVPSTSSTQAQLLQKLEHDTARDRRLAADLNRQRQGLQQDLSRLHEKKARLQDELQRAQQVLGTLHRQQAMWQTQAERLEQQLAQERQQLADGAKERAALEQTEIEAKTTFCREMQDLLNEASRLASSQHETRLVNMITAESAPLLLQPLDSNNSNHDDMVLDEDRAMMESSGDDGLPSLLDPALEAAVSHFLQGVQDDQALEQRPGQLERVIHQLRQRALAQSSKSSNSKGAGNSQMKHPLTESQLLQWEAALASPDDDNNKANGSNHAANLHAFYGTQEEPEDDDEGENAGDSNLKSSQDGQEAAQAAASVNQATLRHPPSLPPSPAMGLVGAVAAATNHGATNLAGTVSAMLGLSRSQ